MDLNKVIVEHKLAVNLTNARLKAENGLVRRYAQINDTIVESHILIHDSLSIAILFLLLTCCWSFLHFSFLVKDLSASILNLEGEDRHRLVDCPDFFHFEFYWLRATGNGSLRDTDDADNLNDRLFRNLGRVLAHAFANLDGSISTIRDEHQALNCRVTFARNNKA